MNNCSWVSEKIDRKKEESQKGVISVSSGQYDHFVYAPAFFLKFLDRNWFTNLIPADREAERVSSTIFEWP